MKTRQAYKEAIKELRAWADSEIYKITIEPDYNSKTKQTHINVNYMSDTPDGMLHSKPIVRLMEMGYVFCGAYFSQFHSRMKADFFQITQGGDKQ